MKYFVLALGLALAGCNFVVDGDHGGGGGGGGDVDMSLPIDTDLGGDVDLAMGNDLAGVPIVCTAGASSCSGSTLVTCPDGTAEVMTACPLGCSTSGGAHCNVIHPRAPVTTGDFDATGLVPVTLSSAIYIGTDNGQIGPNGTPLRQPNNDVNTYEVHQGIGFRGERADVVVVHRLVHQMSAGSHADLTLVKKRAHCAHARSEIDVGSGEHDHGVVAAEFEVGALEVLRTCPTDVAPGGCGTGE